MCTEIERLSDIFAVTPFIFTSTTGLKSSLFLAFCGPILALSSDIHFSPFLCRSVSRSQIPDIMPWYYAYKSGLVVLLFALIARWRWSNQLISPILKAPLCGKLSPIHLGDLDLDLLGLRSTLEPRVWPIRHRSEVYKVTQVLKQPVVNEIISMQTVRYSCKSTFSPFNSFLHWVNLLTLTGL